MKAPIQNPFNDNGHPEDPSFKRNFLAQRKWIILTASIAFLLANNYLAIEGNVTAFRFEINSSDHAIIAGLCVTCCLFFAYMLLISYAFFSKYNIDKRDSFTSLQVEERDTYSDEIESLSGQLEKMEPEIASKSQLLDVSQRSIEQKNELAEQITLLFPGIENEINEKNQASTSISSSLEILDSLRERSLIYSRNDRNEIPKDREKALDQLKAIIRSLVTETERHEQDAASLARLETDKEQLRSQRNELEIERAKVSSDNKNRWLTFYWTSFSADLISFVPTFIGVVFSVSYLISLLTLNASTS